MNRLDVIKAVAKVVGSKEQAAEAVQAAFGTIRAGLDRDRKVLITNFGTFRLQQRRPRLGRNPRTGQQVSVPPRIGIRFKASRNVLN